MLKTICFVWKFSNKLVQEKIKRFKNDQDLQFMLRNEILAFF